MTSSRSLWDPDPPLSLRVHKDLICKSSAFFRSALSHGWKESKEQTVRLVEEDPEIFELYIHWLYRGMIAAFSARPDDFGMAQYLQMARAYVLGDKLQDDDFCDAAIDVFMEGCQQAAWGIGCDTEICRDEVITNIYDNTPESSKLRQMVVDVHTYHGSGGWLPEHVAQAFVHSVASKLLSITQGDMEREDPTYTYNNCKYHKHGPDPKLCYREWSGKRCWYEKEWRRRHRSLWEVV